jgi:predicted ferric reductase
MAVSSRAGTGRGWAIFCIALYLAAVILPMGVATFLGAPGESPLLAASLMAALAGFAVLCLQVPAASRISLFERPFGLDIVFRFHRNMGVLALVLLLVHPLILAYAGGGWKLLAGVRVQWPIWTGRIALLALLANVILSVSQPRLRVAFEQWRLAHDLLGPFVITLGFVHSWFIGEDLKLPFLRALWIGAFGGAVILFLYHRVVRPIMLGRRPYRVTEVKVEIPGVWTVTLSPPPGGRVFDYLPGQFHFITFHRGRGLPVEEHHWTISSSPAREGQVGSTIKALGDFTSTMGETRAGDEASVHGPFGRFSFLLHPMEHHLVFVAGGIGITPLMSMLRYMQDTNDTREVLLLYGNKTQGEIVFDDELSRIEAGGHPHLRVVHVLSSPGKGWEGEKGYVDGEKIMRYCHGDLSARAFYLCGPRGMLDALATFLAEKGVPGGSIRTEIFSFLD